MTDWKEWFAIVANLKSDNRVIGSDIESMYQAFKQRLASESPITLFPKEPLDCQGIIGDIGKTNR